MVAQLTPRRLRLAVLLLCALSGLVAGTLHAADDPKSDREQMQLRRLQQAVRKLEQEKAQIEAEKAQMVQEKSQLDAQLQQNRDLLYESDRNRQGLAERVAVLERELAASRAENASLTQGAAQTQQALQRAATAAQRLDERLAEQRTALSACAASNEKLHGYGMELLERYEKKRCSDALLQADPFTQLKRAEIENFQETYRDQLDEQKLSASPAESDGARDRQ